MAEGTRGQEARRIDEAIREIREQIGSLAEAVKENLRITAANTFKCDEITDQLNKISENSAGSSSQSRKEVSTPFSLIQHQFSRIEFPRFGGIDPGVWIHQCEHYFYNYQTDEVLKIVMAALHLDGEALVWYQGFEKTTNKPDWKSFCEAISLRFSAETTIDAIVNLTKLRQEGAVKEITNLTESLETMEIEVPQKLMNVDILKFEEPIEVMVDESKWIVESKFYDIDDFDALKQFSDPIAYEFERVEGVGGVMSVIDAEFIQGEGLLGGNSYTLDFHNLKPIFDELSLGEFWSNSAYLKLCNRIDFAHYLFDKMSQKYVYSWKVILNGYHKIGRIDNPTMVFANLLEDDAATTAPYWLLGVDGNHPPAKILVPMPPMCSTNNEASMGWPFQPNQQGYILEVAIEAIVTSVYILRQLTSNLNGLGIATGASIHWKKNEWLFSIRNLDESSMFHDQFPVVVNGKPIILEESQGREAATEKTRFIHKKGGKVISVSDSTGAMKKPNGKLIKYIDGNDSLQIFLVGKLYDFDSIILCALRGNLNMKNATDVLDDSSALQFLNHSLQAGRFKFTVACSYYKEVYYKLDFGANKNWKSTEFANVVSIDASHEFLHMRGLENMFPCGNTNKDFKKLVVAIVEELALGQYWNLGEKKIFIFDPGGTLICFYFEEVAIISSLRTSFLREGGMLDNQISNGSHVNWEEGEEKWASSIGLCSFIHLALLGFVLYFVCICYWAEQKL